MTLFDSTPTTSRGAGRRQRVGVRPLVALVLAAPLAAQDELLYSNPSNSSYTAVESYETPLSSFVLQTEAADDFDATGTVERVSVHGKECFPCSPADLDHVTVRFYAWTAAGPGDLLSEQVVPAGDPGLVYDPAGVDDLDITLPEPYTITGKGYVSVQLSMGAGDGYWAWWISNKDAPTDSRLWFRDLRVGTSWGPYVDVLGRDLVADLAFSLWGTSDTPPPPSSDPCGQWGVLSTPTDVEAEQAILRDVSALSDDDVWAVGDKRVEFAPGDDDNLVQALHWDGVRWTEVPVPVPSPYPGGDNAILSAVEAVAPDDVWAAGTYSTTGVDGFLGLELLVVHWDGSAWSLVPNAPLLQAGVSGAWVRGIEVVAPDDVWFVGDFPQVVGTGAAVRYAGAIHWDGTDFTVFDTPLNNTDGNGLNAVSALSSDDVWAVGGGNGNGFLIDPYVVHFDGSTWQLVPTPTPAITHVLFDVAAIAPNDVWAIGQAMTGTGVVGFALHWDGSAWTEVPFTGGSLGLHAFASDDVYAVGGVVSHWDGSAWSLVEDFDGLLSPSLTAVDASASCKLFAVGRDSVGGRLVNHSAKLDADPWTDLGGGTVATPTLSGIGNLESGSVNTLRLVGMPASAPTALVYGSTSIFLPLRGATLVPSPDVLLTGLATDAFGRLDYTVTWTPGVPPGTPLYLQLWSFDLGGAGFVASNGLLGVTP